MCRTVSGMPLSRGVHTVVLVVVDTNGDSSSADRLAQVVSKALQEDGKTASTKAIELTSGAQAAGEEVQNKGQLRRISTDQLMLKEIRSSVRRLVSGRAPLSLQQSFRSLASIQQVVEEMKSESDMAKKKLEDEMLWIYVLRDRCLQKLPVRVRVFFETLREVWGHVIDLYPIVIIVLLLSAYPPAILFGMALVAHEKYVEQKREVLKKLAEEYELKQAEKELKKLEEAAPVSSCVKNKTAKSIWGCMKSRFAKSPATEESKVLPPLHANEEASKVSRPASPRLPLHASPEASKGAPPHASKVAPAVSPPRACPEASKGAPEASKVPPAESPPRACPEASKGAPEASKVPPAVSSPRACPEASKGAPEASKVPPVVSASPPPEARK